MANTLNQLIMGLNKEEIRYFKLMQSFYKYNEADRKDLTLFDYIKKSADAYDEEYIATKLYGKKDKNAFYRLKNRLIEDISLSLVSLHIKDSKENYLLSLLSLAKMFRQRLQTDSSYYYLKKAEKYAEQSANYELLEIIYSENIKLSQHHLSINPEEYVEKRKKNRERINRLLEIDDVLSVLNYKIRLSQNLSSNQNSIIKMLDNTLKNYAQNKTLIKDPVFRFKTYDAISKILLQKNDFITLEKYLQKTWHEFNKDKLFNEANHEIKLQMIVYLANVMFKNKKTTESLKYAFLLPHEMNAYRGQLRNKYLFFYYNILINNYAESDKEKAIEILNDAASEKIIMNNNEYSFYILLNLVMLLFDSHRYKESNKQLIKLKLHERFNQIDEGFRLKIMVAEMIIRYELHDADFIEMNLPKIKKEFAGIISKPEYYRQKLMLELLSYKILSGHKEIKKANKIQQTLLSVKADKADLIDYNSWLTMKIYKT